MSKNINQVYTANPITTNSATDLMYFGQSPYTSGDDAAMTYSNFSAQFALANGTHATGTWAISISGNAATATTATTSTTATNATNVATNQVTANQSYYPLMVGSSTNGNQAVDLGTGLTFNPSTNTLSTTTFAGALSGNAATATTAAACTGNSATATTAAACTGNSATATTISSIAATSLYGNSTGSPANGQAIALGTGLSFSGTSLNVTGLGSWIDETGASVTMATNTGYTSDDGASLVTFTLPTTSAIGDFVEINGKGSGGWSIAQATGQQIHINSATTTSGAGGSLSSTGQYDNVRLRCLTANTIWTVVSMQSAGLTVV